MPEDISVDLTRSQRRRRALRRQITHAALDLFEERGFDRVTIDDIAERVNISQRTFFRHFPSKDDVLSVYGVERREEFEVLIESKLVAGRRLPRAISEAIRDSAALWEQDREFYRRVYGIPGSTNDNRQAVSQSRWARTIGASLAPHVGRATTDPELIVVSEAFAAAFRAAQLGWHVRDADGSLIDLLDPTLPLAEATYRASSLPSRSLLALTAPAT